MRSPTRSRYDIPCALDETPDDRLWDEFDDEATANAANAADAALCRVPPERRHALIARRPAPPTGVI